MQNKSFNNFTNQDYNSLSNWLNKLDPYEFSLFGVLAAYIIAPSLNANQQNSVGNWFEEIGQILLTISAQKITYKQAKNKNTTSHGFEDNFNDIDLNNLKNEIERLKKLLEK